MSSTRWKLSKYAYRVDKSLSTLQPCPVDVMTQEQGLRKSGFTVHGAQSPIQAVVSKDDDYIWEVSVDCSTFLNRFILCLNMVELKI